MPIRLIATDLDGTLLSSAGTLSPRSRAALGAAQAAGLWVVPVTARQPHAMRAGAASLGLTWALCSNGAYGIHLRTGECLFETHIATDVQRALVHALRGRLPELLFVSVRQGGEVFRAQTGYADLAQLSDHGRDPSQMDACTLDEVLAEPSLKLIVRHPTMGPADLLPHVRALDLPGFAVTHSGAPFLEVLADGVSKAWGLAQLCAHLGVRREEVLAFGDAPNDTEMLAWAGRGVAVANAHPEAQAAADEQTLSNDEDGVAVVIEALLQAQAAGQSSAG